MHQGVPMTVLGICGIIGGICVLFLPETGNIAIKCTTKEKQPKLSVASIE